MGIFQSVADSYQLITLLSQAQYHITEECNICQ